MKKISQIEGTAACILAENISTDIISPSELYLKPRSAYGPGLFAPRRYLSDGSENSDFALNKPKHRDAKVLVCGPNFGCGSSREIAVWCLQDYGIECVIGASFAEIFFENALKSGLLAVTVSEAEVARIAGEVEHAANPICSVDLDACNIRLPSGASINFEIDPFRRTMHREGLEEIDLILKHETDITSFQRQSRQMRPWLLPAASPAAHERKS